MKILFQERAWDDHLHWQATGAKVLKRLNGLIRECTRTTYSGTGKPEPLRGSSSGWWSRRIDQDHRIIYRVTDDSLLIAQCRHHY